MKFRVVSTKEEIKRLSHAEKMIHLAFRASNVDFLQLMQRCPRLRVIQIPKSYTKSMSTAIKTFLEMQDIIMLEGDVWGHRKDLDEYYTVDEAIVDEIKDMAKVGKPIEEMTEELKKKTRIGQDLIKYIAMTDMIIA